MPYFNVTVNLPFSYTVKADDAEEAVEKAREAALGDLHELTRDGYIEFGDEKVKQCSKKEVEQIQEDEDYVVE